MSLITSDSLRTALSHKRLDPVYFLFGEEDLLIEEATSDILALAVDASTREFNFELLYGGETTFPDVVERASAYPLMAERRVVVVRELDRLISLRGKPDASSAFGRYLAAPAETTVLLLTAVRGDIMGRSKAKAPYDMIIKHATSINFRRVYDREVPSWTAGRIRAKGKQIRPEALELFVGYAGSSLRVIDGEIEKLITFVEDRRTINTEDVRSVVGTSKNFNVFELQKAVGERNLELSIEIAERMLRAGEPVVLVLTMLTRYFLILWRLVELRSTTRDQNEMARGVGISKFFLNEYLAALGRYPIESLRNAFEALLAADVAVKSSNIAAETVLQLMLTSIIRGTNLMGDMRHRYQSAV